MLGRSTTCTFLEGLDGARKNDGDDVGGGEDVVVDDDDGGGGGMACRGKGRFPCAWAGSVYEKAREGVRTLGNALTFVGFFLFSIPPDGARHDYINHLLPPYITFTLLLITDQTTTPASANTSSHIPMLAVSRLAPLFGAAEEVKVVEEDGVSARPDLEFVGFLRLFCS